MVSFLSWFPGVGSRNQENAIKGEFWFLLPRKLIVNAPS